MSIRIRVRGRLGERVEDAFDSITFVHRSGATELVGEVVDETQLHALLACIRGLGLGLESMHITAACPASPTPTSPAQQEKGTQS